MADDARPGSAIRPQNADSSGSAAPSLRILAVGNMYPPHHAGGYELMWQAAVQRARRLGHQVRVIASDYHASDELSETDPDVHRTLRWYWDLDRYEFPQLSPLQRVQLERHNATELDRHLHEFGPQVVSWWSMGCMSLSLIERVRRSGLRAAFIVHDDWLVYGPQRDQWIRAWRGRRRVLAPLAERLLRLPTTVDLAGAGRFVFNSRYTLEAARQAGITPPAATVVPPGIEKDLQDPLPSQPWAWRLLYIGRIDHQKGVDTAVRALAHLPDEATLEVWGTGDEAYIDPMKALARELGAGERVRFRGWAGPAERVSAYRDADAVVSTSQGGTAEFLRDGENALLFEPDDAAGLARAVRRLAGDQPLRGRLLAGGQLCAASYTVERFAKEIVEEILRAASP